MDQEALPGRCWFAEGETPAERSAALSRTTHLAVGAHPDDLEIMGIHGILECFGRGDRGFWGVVACDGAGSSRTGPYASVSDAEMRLIRSEEQLAAARLGRYTGVCQLGHASAEVRSRRAQLAGELGVLFRQAAAQVVYTHSPFDQHETHVAVLQAVLEALRGLAPFERPERVLGCEVWGSLDFVEHPARVELDVSARPHLQASLLGVHDSQIAGGKRYDLAALGRRRAHATFSRSHESDSAEGILLALDLTPLLEAGAPSLSEYVQRIFDESAAQVRRRLTTD